MKKMNFFVFLMALCFSKVVLSAPSNLELAKAEVEFHSQKYTQAIHRTKNLLDRLKLNTVNEITRAHKLLGVSYCETHQSQKAQEHFYSLISFSLTETIENLTHNPRCLNLFEEERKLYQEKRKPYKMQTLTLDENEKPKLLYSEQIGMPLWQRLTPLGVAHFTQGNDTYGKAFLASELTLIASTLTSLFLFRSEQEENGTFQNPDQAEIYRTLFWSSLGASVVVGLWDVISAHHTYKKKYESKYKSKPFHIKPLITATK